MKRTGAIAVIIILSISIGCLKEEVDEYAMISFLLGDVTMNNQPAGIGDIVKEMDVIKTGAASFCDVRIGGSIIRIKAKSKVTMTKLIRTGNAEDTTLGLSMGKMLCKPKKLLKSERFIVKTPTAVAGVRGTQFTVETDAVKTTRIKVFNGKVRVARRVRQFENSVDRVLEVAPVLGEEKKVVITKKEVEKAEEKIDRIIKTQGGAEGETAIVAAIEKSTHEIAVPKKAIEKFKATDFQKDKKEMIDIKPKPPVVIKKIIRVIKKEKNEPKPDGRLLITRYEIYFIKSGKVQWEGPVIDKPVAKGEFVYIASGDYVFCAQIDGPVKWRKNIKNKGKVEYKENKLMVHTPAGVIELDPETGQQR